MPSIKVAGDIENQIASAFERGDEDTAYKTIYKFLSEIQEPNISISSNKPLIKKPGESEDDLSLRQQQGQHHASDLQELCEHLSLP